MLHTIALARLMYAKLQKLVCVCTVTWNFDIWLQASEDMQYMRDARHKLAFGLPHYICGVATATVVVRNEMQLFWS